MSEGRDPDFGFHIGIERAVSADTSLSDGTLPEDESCTFGRIMTGCHVCLALLLLPGPASLLSAVIFFDMDYKDNCTESTSNQTEYSTNDSAVDVTTAAGVTNTYMDTEWTDMTSPGAIGVVTTVESADFVDMTSVTSLYVNNTIVTAACDSELTGKCRHGRMDVGRK